MRVSNFHKFVVVFFVVVVAWRDKDRKDRTRDTRDRKRRIIAKRKTRNRPCEQRSWRQSLFVFRTQRQRRFFVWWWCCFKQHQQQHQQQYKEATFFWLMSLLLPSSSSSKTKTTLTLCVFAKKTNNAKKNCEEEGEKKEFCLCVLDWYPKLLQHNVWNLFCIDPKSSGCSRSQLCTYLSRVFFTKC